MQGLSEQMIGHKRRFCQRRGVPAGEEVKHGGVPGDHQRAHQIAVYPRVSAGTDQQRLHSIVHENPQTVQLSGYRRADAAHDIRRHRGLGILHTAAGQARAAVHFI